METISITVDRAGCGRLLAPAGIATPHDTIAGVRVEGGRIDEVAPVAGLDGAALVVVPEADEVTIRYAIAGPAPGQPYPEAAFAPRANRYTTAAAELAGEVRALAGRMRDGGEEESEGEPAIAAALAEEARARFAYAHPEARFNDGHEAVPYLACGTTPGSCVDINTYFVASLRAAGIEAAYLYGVFFPAERDRVEGGRTVRHAVDGHCWVATRHAGPDGAVTLEWDVAHHMKAGLSRVAPALDPRPGRRVALSHSMGHALTVDGRTVEFKVLGTPVGVGQDGLIDPPIRAITMSAIHNGLQFPNRP